MNREQETKGELRSKDSTATAHSTRPTRPRYRKKGQRDTATDTRTASVYPSTQKRTLQSQTEQSKHNVNVNVHSRARLCDRNISLEIVITQKGREGIEVGCVQERVRVSANAPALKWVSSSVF